MKTGRLKGYKGGICRILMLRPILNDRLLQEFHEDRCKTIESLKYEYDRFETDLI